MKQRKIGPWDIYPPENIAGRQPEKKFQEKFQDEFRKIEKNFSRRPRTKIIFSKKIFLAFFCLLAAAVLSTGLHFGWKILSVKQKISFGGPEKTTLLGDVQSIISSALPGSKKLAGEKEGRVNILFLGIAGKNNPGQNLTDTIMIASVDTKNKKVALLSLPRDLYVPVSGAKYSAKINSLYQYGLSTGQGVEPLKKTLEEITSIPLHYFLILDFEGFKRVIDDIGGINVYVERDIRDTRYPGPNFSYETFEIQKGLRFLDGETALKYARVRHGDPEGDFGRLKRQQKVIQVAKKKVFTLQTFLNVFTLDKLIDSLGDHLKTNIQFDEIESFVRLARETDTQNITTAVADAWQKDSLLKASRAATSRGAAFVLVPRVGTCAEIQDLAKNIFDLDALRRRQEEIQKENACVVIFNRSADPRLGFKIKDLLQNKLGVKNVFLADQKEKNNVDFSTVKILDGAEKFFTLDEILKKLPAKIKSETDADENSAIMKEADFAVVLGRDLEKTYAFEEYSFESWQKNSADNQEYFEMTEN